MNIEKLLEFITPYYKDKDTMHDLSHIERVKKSVDRVLENTKIEIDKEVLEYALYFHGFIYRREEKIKEWMLAENINEEIIKRSIEAAWESQKYKIGISNEGKILHDAHMIEGGKNFLIVKSLVTGSARGQSLEETIKYIEENIIDKGECYTDYGKKRYREQQLFAKEFISDLRMGLD